MLLLVYRDSRKVVRDGQMKVMTCGVEQVLICVSSPSLPLPPCTLYFKAFTFCLQTIHFLLFHFSMNFDT